MNKAVALVLAIVAFVAGFLISGMSGKKSAVLGGSGLKIAEELIGNPVAGVIAVEGKVKEVGSDSLVLEKDEKELRAYFGNDSVYARMENGELSATPSATQALSSVPVGSEIIGGVEVKKEGDSSYKIYTTNFFVK